VPDSWRQLEKEFLRRRGELLEPSFARACETGGTRARLITVNVIAFFANYALAMRKFMQVHASSCILTNVLRGCILPSQVRATTLISTAVVCSAPKSVSLSKEYIGTKNPLSCRLWQTTSQQVSLRTATSADEHRPTPGLTMRWTRTSNYWRFGHVVL